MDRRDLTFTHGLIFAGALALFGTAQAESRPEVLERIKPVGEVVVEGAAEAAAPAAVTAPATPAPVETAAADTAPAMTETAAPTETQAAAPAETQAAAPVGDAQAIAQAKGCLACHQIEMKVVGPAYKDVAAKYRSDPAAIDTLLAKVQAGGVGNWGQIPMPPQAHVPEAELRSVIEWIMSL